MVDFLGMMKIKVGKNPSLSAQNKAVSDHKHVCDRSYENIRSLTGLIYKSLIAHKHFMNTRKAHSCECVNNTYNFFVM